MCKRLYCLVVVALMGVLFVCRPNCAKAQGADYAVLMQQILQFIQDYDMDSGGLMSSFSDDGGNTYGILKKMLDLNEAKIQEAVTISNSFNKNPAMKALVNRLGYSTQRMLFTCKDIIESAEYIQEFGSVKDFQTIMTYEREFRSKAVDMVRASYDSVDALKSLRHENSLDLYNTVDGISQKCLADIEKMSADYSQLVSTVTDEVFYRSMASENNKLNNVYFY